MIEFTHTQVYGWDSAIRGMRNSWESHSKMDSYYETVEPYELCQKDFILGHNDKTLMMNLIKAGASHAKFMRQIFISVDINAPLYWWKEFDQYKVGTVTNSESTMHTIQKESMVDELFSIEVPAEFQEYWQQHLEHLEHVRNMYNVTKDKKYWRYLIQLLPSGWMQKRTTTLNYGVVANAYHDRKAHRLTEWREDFKYWVHTLPYSFLITGEEK